MPEAQKSGVAPLAATYTSRGRIRVYGVRPPQVVGRRNVLSSASQLRCFLGRFANASLRFGYCCPRAAFGFSDTLLRNGLLANGLSHAGDLLLDDTNKPTSGLYRSYLCLKDGIRHCIDNRVLRHLILRPGLTSKG
jgi:hypothetical protein